jgi:hypothetical protein
MTKIGRRDGGYCRAVRARQDLDDSRTQRRLSMRVLRASSIEEYARWYLQRERRKRSASSIDDEPDKPVEVMWLDHPGKMRNWFNSSTR